jgi:uncharacterized Zn finger protein
MPDNIDIAIRSGTVEARVADTPVRTFNVSWSIPVFEENKKDALYQAFAEDAFLAGRWAAGIPTETDKSAANATENDWRSNCGCGRTQPCRHSATVLFRFRERAKADPWLWLEVRGISREDAYKNIHAYRLRMIESPAATDKDVIDVPESEDESESGESPILIHAEDPPFWNRDISFADWLRLIYRNTKKGDVSW